MELIRNRKPWVALQAQSPSAISVNSSSPLDQWSWNMTLFSSVAWTVSPKGQLLNLINLILILSKIFGKRKVGERTGRPTAEDASIPMSHAEDKNPTRKTLEIYNPRRHMWAEKKPKNTKPVSKFTVWAAVDSSVVAPVNSLDPICSSRRRQRENWFIFYTWSFFSTSSSSGRHIFCDDIWSHLFWHPIKPYHPLSGFSTYMI